MAEEKDNTIYINPDDPVYISFTGADKEYVIRFIQLLDERHIYHLDSLTKEEMESVVDEKRRTEISKFEEEIGDGKYVVIFYSPEYFESYHCMNEYAWIRKKEKESKFYYTVRCKKFDFDNIKQRLKHFWSGERGDLEDLDYQTTTKVNRAAIDNMYYCEKNTNYSVYFLGQYFRDNAYYGVDKLENLADKIRTDLGMIHKNNSDNIVSRVSHPSSAIPVYALKRQFYIDPMRFSYEDKFPQRSDNQKTIYYGRESEVNKLHDLFDKVNMVSLVAIGGIGKTFFAHRYKEDEVSLKKYGRNIHHIYLNYDLMSDFVECMDSFINNYEFSVALSQIEKMSDKVKGIIDVLKQTVAAKTLFVIDINITDKEQFEKNYCKVNFLDKLSLLAKDGKWNILLLSRLGFKVDDLEVMGLSGFEGEQATAVKMFRDISGVQEDVCTNQRLIEILGSRGFYFHPLLISVLASFCRRERIKNFDRVQKLMDEVKKEGLPGDMSATDKSIEKYLDRLIDFKSYEEAYGGDFEILLRHFILWEYNNVPYEVIEFLLDGYPIDALRKSLDVLVNDMILTKSDKEYRVNGMTIKEQCDMIYNNNNKPDEWNYVAEKKAEFREKLIQRGYPVSEYVGYRMHGFIGDALRKKAESSSYDYSKYINTIKGVLSSPKSTNILRSVYHNIYESLCNYNHILKAPESFWLLMAAHWAYYPSETISNAVKDMSKNLIETIDVDYRGCYADIDNLLKSMHDFANVMFYYSNSIEDDEHFHCKKFAEKVIKIRTDLLDILSGDDLLDNRKKLAVEKCFLGCVCADNGENKEAKVYYQAAVDELKSYSGNDDATKALLLQLSFYMGEVSLSLKAELNTEPFNYSAEPVMVDVIGGTFDMGCDDEFDERPIHEVTIDTFKIGKYPVTQLQWDMVMGDDIPSYTRVDYHRGLGPDYPMYNVSWDDVDKFCRRMRDKDCHYSLPTEAEWEYAARGGINKDESRYSGSNEIDDVAWYIDNSCATTHRVGEKNHPNSLGIHDMSGNVWEWCQDWYNPNFYQECKDNNQPNPLCNKPINVKILNNSPARVLRGGSWGHGAQYCRVFSLEVGNSFYRSSNIGFRLALSFVKH